MLHTVCFRLLAGVRPRLSAPGGAQADSSESLTCLLAKLGVECGLDVRAASSPAADFAEIAWGDCACSLYTRREGRQRAVKFVEALLERGLAVQLLLYQDGETFNWEGQSAERVSLEAFRLEALRILPEGRVAEIVPE